MNELAQQELERYFKPIYYVEYEQQNEGELFPRVFRVGFYDKSCNKKEALRAFNELNGARVIEKSIRTGAEKVIIQRASE